MVNSICSTVTNILYTEESEWSFDHVVPTVKYTTCNNTAVQVQQAPPSPSIVLQQKLTNDVMINYLPYSGQLIFALINKKIFCHQIFRPVTLCDAHTF